MTSVLMNSSCFDSASISNILMVFIYKITKKLISHWEYQIEYRAMQIGINSKHSCIQCIPQPFWWHFVFMSRHLITRMGGVWGRGRCLIHTEYTNTIGTVKHTTTLSISSMVRHCNLPRNWNETEFSVIRDETSHLGHSAANTHEWHFRSNKQVSVVPVTELRLQWAFQPIALVRRRVGLGSNVVDDEAGIVSQFIVGWFDNAYASPWNYSKSGIIEWVTVDQSHTHEQVVT